MLVFDCKGGKGININGKDYFLIRGYTRNYDDFIFLQVSGSTSLRKEDLPNKDWNVFVTKTAEQRVYTAYRKPYFNYKTTKADVTLCYIGASTQGSYFIALKDIARIYKLVVSDEALFERAGREEVINSRGLEKLNDKGILDVDAVMVRYDNWDMKESRARELIFGEEEASDV